MNAGSARFRQELDVAQYVDEGRLFKVLTLLFCRHRAQDIATGGISAYVMVPNAALRRSFAGSSNFRNAMANLSWRNCLGISRQGVKLGQITTLEPFRRS
jgi:hypothetical protein